jgi:hypothetical protein
MANEEATHHHSGNDLYEYGATNQESRSDENLSDVWNLCFGWQATDEPKGLTEGSLEFFRGLDGIPPTFICLNTVNRRDRFKYAAGEPAEEQSSCFHTASITRQPRRNSLFFHYSMPQLCIL